MKRGTLFIFLLILSSLAWYLLSDRFTPYTSQARVQGYVVGVAPKVAGVITQVWVENNQEVEEGERLFQIDPSQYEIALTVPSRTWRIPAARWTPAVPGSTPPAPVCARPWPTR